MSKFNPNDSAYVGSTQQYYQEPHTISNSICCKQLPEKAKLSKLKPLKFSKLDTEDLNIAKYDLDKYSHILDKMKNEPFIEKNISWFTYLFLQPIQIGIANIRVWAGF